MRILEFIKAWRQRRKVARERLVANRTMRKASDYNKPIMVSGLWPPSPSVSDDQTEKRR